MQTSPEYYEIFKSTSKMGEELLNNLEAGLQQKIANLMAKASKGKINFDPEQKMIELYNELKKLTMGSHRNNLIKQRDLYTIFLLYALVSCRYYKYTSKTEKAWLYLTQANYHLGRAQMIEWWSRISIAQQENSTRAKRAASMRHGKRVQREKDVVLNKMKEHAPKEGWFSRKKMFADIKASLKQALQDEFGELTPSDIETACDRIQNSFSRWMRTDPVFKDSFNSHMKNKVTLPYPKQ